MCATTRRLAKLPKRQGLRSIAGFIAAIRFDALVSAGVAPSEVELREMLMTLVEQMPEGFEPSLGLERAIVEIDRYLASREPEEGAASGGSVRAPSAEVLFAAQMLAGKRVVMIGGECRPLAKAALERELNLSELCWISSREHQSIAPFEPEVARADTALVLLAIRWASHSFEGVKEMCERYGKPFVRLPGGYNASQVAHQVVKQVSGTLVAAAV